MIFNYIIIGIISFWYEYCIRLVMYIKLVSLSNKKWLVNVYDIILVEERTEFTFDEIQPIPLLAEFKRCCAVIIRGRNETFWVRNSYSSIKKLLTQYGLQMENEMASKSHR